MPPRKTRAAKAAQEPPPDPEPPLAGASDPSSSSEQATATSSNGRPAKKARKSEEASTLLLVEEEAPVLPSAPSDLPPPPSPPAAPPAAPEEDGLAPPPPPPPTDLPLPPPPTDEEPPPPPPPTFDGAPPPPPLAEAGLAAGEDEEDVQDAEYWERLAEEDRQKEEEKSQDLYLDTINRSVLDFDFEKLCSVSLSNINVYTCLVCGKYFQGRGKNSYAYFHSINDGHRVYMNLETAKVYILPDGYQVSSASLSDIVYLLQPTYTPKQIRRLDAPDARPSIDLQGKPYYPGYLGLNNIGGNDYVNVVIQALAHIAPLRDYFLTGSLRPDNNGQGAKSTSTSATVARGSGGVSYNPTLANSSELVRRFAALLRKIWNPRAFKAQVSPHEFLQEVTSASKGRFRLMEQGDPVDLLGWLLNQLHMDLNGGSRKKPSIISRCLQGEVRIESQKVFVRTGLEAEGEMDVEDGLDQDGRKEGGQEDEYGNAKFNIDRDIKIDRSPFFLLAIDLPPPPVFQDVVEKNIIPQVSIAQVLAKYDGVSFQEARGMIRRYKITKLPPYVILHFRRFTKNNFVEERNPTIVNFPIKGLDLRDYVDDPSLTPLSALYDMVANITHEATPGTVRENSVWRSQVHTSLEGEPINPSSSSTAAGQPGSIKAESIRRGGERDGEEAEKAEEKWFQIQDLIVEDINRQMIFLGETYIQVWKRRRDAGSV